MAYYKNDSIFLSVLNVQFPTIGRNADLFCEYTYLSVHTHVFLLMIQALMDWKHLYVALQKHIKAIILTTMVCQISLYLNRDQSLGARLAATVFILYSIIQSRSGPIYLPL